MADAADDGGEQCRERYGRRGGGAHRRTFATQAAKTRVRPACPSLELGSMLRIAVGLGLVALGACASPAGEAVIAPVAWKSGSDRTHDGPSEFVDAQAETSSMDDDQAEVECLQAIRTAEDPIGPALRLVTLLEGQERHEDALAVLEQLGARRPTTALDVAIASVLRDLGRRPEALVRLQRAQEGNPSAFGPGLVHEMAELAVLCGDYAAAAESLGSLRASIEADAYEKLHATELEALRSCIARRAVPRQLKVRDLLADLRGAADSEHRLHTLQLLLQQRSEVVERACILAVGDEDARLRAVGVQHAKVPEGSLAEFCAVALSDPDASVRAAGARRADDLPPAERVPLLLPALCAESSASTFAEIDARLCAAVGSGKPAESAQASDASFRRLVVEERRRIVER